MIALPRPEVICTHESDLDGFVSGLLLQGLAEKLFGQRPPSSLSQPQLEAAQFVREGCLGSRYDFRNQAGPPELGDH